MGDDKKSMKYYEDGLQIMRKEMGKGSNQVAKILTHLGKLSINKSEYSKAMDYLQEALNI